MKVITAAQAETRSTISIWFWVNGFVVASWVAHVPRQKEALGVTSGILGLALLCMALGSVLGMAFAPAAIGRIGAGRASWSAGWVQAALLAAPLSAWSAPTLGFSLLLLGLAVGLMDVTMNAAAADCEAAAGRSVMSSFHGWFSVGMAAGVFGGVGALAVGLPPTAHALLVLLVCGGFLCRARPRVSELVASSKKPSSSTAGLDRRATALAGLAFVCLFIEGAMADWSGLLAATFGAGPVAAPLAYASFTTAWAAGRFVGDRATERFGDATLILYGGLLAAAGVGLGILLESPAGVAVGCAIAGLGVANSAPILFRTSANADATGCILAMATGVGYAGFLVGPPLVGFSADAVGLPNAMLLVVAGGLLFAAGSILLRRAEQRDQAPGRTVIACRAVLFDMDGTLVDSAEVVEEVWRHWAEMVGVDPGPILAVHHGRRPEETLAMTYPHLATAELCDWVQSTAESRTQGLQATAGAARLLDSLSGRPIAVVTSATRRLAESRLRAVGLWRDALLVAADDVSEGKPSPEGYLAAARRLGIEPHECVVVEDAPAGVEAGLRAGMTVIGMSRRAPIELDSHHCIDDFAGVLVEHAADGVFRLVLPASRRRRDAAILPADAKWRPSRGRPSGFGCGRPSA